MKPWPTLGKLMPATREAYEATYDTPAMKTLPQMAPAYEAGERQSPA